MTFYPYSYPLILNDSIFTEYGGHTGTTTPAQRTAAYVIAEKDASVDIGTFLLPTRVTGTHTVHLMKPVYLDYGYVERIVLSEFLNVDGSVCRTISGTTSEVALSEPDYGVVQYCQSGGPYKMRFTYDTGLPTGTANQPDVLLALTTIADIVLNEIVGFGNESSGDVGITSFSNQDYSEKRYGLVNTSFGSSPRANFAHKQLTKLRKHIRGSMR